MAGQRYRVWPARLTPWLILLIGLGLFVTLGIRHLIDNWLIETPVGSIQAQNRPGDASGPGAQPDTLRDAHPLDEVLSLANTMMQTHRLEHQTYRAVIRKRERIGKQLGPESKMAIKLRYREPQTDDGLRAIDVYLKFLEPKSLSGREVIWRQGIHDDLMVVHESGLLNITRVELSPTSRLAMLGNRYPISQIGIERLLAKLLAKGNRDRGLGDCKVNLTEPVEVAGRACKRIEVCHPDREVIVGDQTFEHEFHKAIIDIDLELGIPIRYASYMWPEISGGDPVLDEEFVYENLELDVALDDQDFDPDNPAYNYP
ncbi:MAG: DUF1571 domain-containing protein [Pirellula sp.]|nr:DUF1571 domain-containing protein [Pirellula sp.]